MTDRNHSDDGIVAMADLMDAAHAVINPESARLHGVAESEYETDLQHGSAALAAAAADGFTPVLLLGQGSSADVWRCADEALNREIALKTIRPGSRPSPEAAEALLRCEAEILSGIHHAGVVHVIRHTGQGDASYLAMQYVDGDTLTVHCKVLSLGLEPRLGLFQQVLDVAAYLHSEGVIHGDIKPDHILVREGGHPVLIDFGLAAQWRYTESLAPDQHRVGGSGPYCAPEVLDGTLHRPDPGQDVYALGVILKELLEAPGVPGDDPLVSRLARLAEQATQADPAKRFADAGAMRTAYQAIIDPDTEPGNSNSPSGRAPHASPRKTIAFALLAALFIAAIGTAWIQTAGRDQPEQAGGPGPGSTPRDAVPLSQQAGLLEGVLTKIAASDLAGAQEQFSSATDGLEPTAGPWEIRHLAYRLSGRGLATPYTDSPYAAPFALDAAYHPSSQTLVYVRPDDTRYEIWMRARDQAPRLLATSPDFIQAIATAPHARQVAGLIGDGSVGVWSVSEDGAGPVTQHVLPREPDAKKAWFGADGKHLYVFAPGPRTVECWSVSGVGPAELLWTAGQADDAYALPSGRGQLMVATQSADAPTTLRVISEAGEDLRTIPMPDSALPVAADALPNPDSPVCLGMDQGYVRLFDPELGWLDPIDLGVNQTVTAVAYSPGESRVFAGMGRVHILDTDGRLMMRLGDRNAPHEHITALHYSQDDAALTAVTLRQVWRWSCPPTDD
ncbi:MAG: WD40 repeat domain-containing serine/threonine protein kinase [Planctomycetota bacterium]